MLASTEISIVTPALRALGNVVTGSDQQTEAVIHAGCIPVICSLLSHSKVSFLVQTFLTIGKGRSGGTDYLDQRGSVRNFNQGRLGFKIDGAPNYPHNLVKPCLIFKILICAES